MKAWSSNAAYPIQAEASHANLLHELSDWVAPVFVVVDNFLNQAEMADLLRFVLESKTKFTPTKVINYQNETPSFNANRRRSREINDCGVWTEVFQKQIAETLPKYRSSFNLIDFSSGFIEVGIVASGEGDFFRPHIDNGHERFRNRHLSFVYYFHKEPKAFLGGELRLFWQPYVHIGEDLSMVLNRFESVVPANNRLVIFKSDTVHEVTTVHVNSHAFADSRFALTGWVYVKDVD